MDLFLALLSGFTLGCLHAFDVDHITAVTAFSSKTRKTVTALRLGITWGLGHSVTLLVLGSVIVFFRLSIPAIMQNWAEMLVGILLMALGAWTLRSVMRDRHMHVHRHAHDGHEHIHVHAHAAEGAHDHHHRHSLFAIGAAHGLAGTGSVVLLIPVACATQPLSAIGFLVLFGTGTMLAMGLFSLLFSHAVHRVTSERFLFRVRSASGAASVLIGIMWITERIL